jgi:hypothetical protein
MVFFYIKRVYFFFLTLLVFLVFGFSFSFILVFVTEESLVEVLSVLVTTFLVVLSSITLGSFFADRTPSCALTQIVNINEEKINKIVFMALLFIPLLLNFCATNQRL